MYEKNKLDEDIVASDSELMDKESNSSSHKNIKESVDKSNDNHNKDNFIAGLSNLVSTFLWALSVIFHKYIFINNHNFGPLNQLFFKYLAATIISIVYVKKYYSKEQIDGLVNFCETNKKMMILRCFSGWFAAFNAVFAVKFISPTILGCINTFIPLATSILTNYTSSNHDINKKDFLIFSICIICSLILNLINYNLTLNNMHVDLNTKMEDINEKSTSFVEILVGMLFSFGFLISSAARNVTQKFIKDLDIFLAVMTIYSACLIGFFACLILLEPISTDFKYIFMMFFLGSFEFLCLLLNVYAINKGDVNFIQQISYSFLPFVCVLSYIFTNELFNIPKVILILIILSINIHQTYLSFLKSKQ